MCYTTHAREEKTPIMQAEANTENKIRQTNIVFKILSHKNKRIKLNLLKKEKVIRSLLEKGLYCTQCIMCGKLR